MNARTRTWALVAVLGVLPAGLGAQDTEADGPLPVAVDEQAVTLDLAEVLNLAIGGSRNLEQARLALSQAEGQVREAWSAIYPRVDFSTSYSRNLSPPVSFLPAIFIDPDADPDELIQVQFGADNAWGLNLGLEQTLFSAGAFIGLGAAGRFEDLQVETVRGARHDVLTQVRLLYYELLLAQTQEDLIARSVERVRESLAETQALNRAGLSSDYDVLRLEVELANLEPDLTRAQNEERRLSRELATELGLEAGSMVEVEGSLAELNLDDPAANTPGNAVLLAMMGVEEPTTTNLDPLVQQANMSNSQLQQAGLTTDLRGSELQAERAEYLPEVSLFANYDIAAQQNGSPDFFGGPMERGYGRVIGVRVSLPVFTGFQRAGRVDQMQAQLRSAEVQLDLAREQVRNEVQTLIERAEESRARVQSQRLAVVQARRGFEIANAQYQEGLGSQLELTDAEVALRQSEFNYAQAMFDYLANRAQIDRIVGQVPTPSGS